MPQRIWTFSNALSLLRVILIIPIALLLLRNDPASNLTIVALIVLGGLTDLFDGMLARQLNEVTEFGKIIDPLADKICVGVVAVILAFQNKLPAWFLVIAIVRDLIILIGGMYVKRSRGILLQSNIIGKWAVTAVAFYILVVILNLEAIEILKTFLLAASTIMLAISFALYLKRFMSTISQHESKRRHRIRF